MRSRYVVRITPDDVGSRVTVRHRRPVPGDGPTTSDVVGQLQAWADGLLRIERRDGTVVRVSEDDLLAAKVIPPRPVRVERPPR